MHRSLRCLNSGRWEVGVSFGLRFMALTIDIQMVAAEEPAVTTRLQGLSARLHGGFVDRGRLKKLGSLTLITGCGRQDRAYTQLVAVAATCAVGAAAVYFLCNAQRTRIFRENIRW